MLFRSNDTATTEIYTDYYTLSLHDALPISAGAYASRAASAIGFIDQMVDYARRNAPLPEPITAREVGTTAAFLCSPLASGITGACVFVDKGIHAMGIAVDKEGALKA